MPHVDPPCTTHHFACACREARFKRMEKLLEEVLTWGTPAFSVELWLDLRDRIEEVLREGKDDEGV